MLSYTIYTIAYCIRFTSGRLQYNKNNTFKCDMHAIYASTTLPFIYWLCQYANKINQGGLP